MIIERGSTWKKWDFHVHTPYSILNNDYGFSPYEPCEGKDPFDEYVVRLFTKAVEQNVAAIGITDYFCIDGYKRIQKEYLCDPDKMACLFPDGELLERVNRIYIFPNIELRLDTFVGKKAHSVNYHVIFSDEVSIDDIEQNFLSQLQLAYQPGSTLALTRQNIERIGREYKESNPTKGDNYLIGLEQAVVNYQQVLQVLDNLVFQDKYIITIPVDEDLSGIDWSGRDYSTRKILYRQCHCLLTSNAGTRKWALAKGEEEERIKEFGSIMPCIWGSDAHNYDQMFVPAEDRNCWIKAELTFDGLQQILFEPEERVRIQKDCPDEKDPHQLIDYIRFCDNRFQEEAIYFSEGLTCIIGGKSTGKSILLRHLADAVAHKQVVDREKAIKNARPPLEVPVDVMWKDGTAGERKIIYIPQSWLNRVVDEKDGDSALNDLLSEILLQQDDVVIAYRTLREAIKGEMEAVKHSILDYVTARQQAEELEKRLMSDGRSEAFETTIAALTTQREELSSSAGITPEMLQRYSELELRIGEINESIRKLSAEEAMLEFCGSPFVYVPVFTQLDRDEKPIYSLDNIPSVKDAVLEVIQQMNDSVTAIWTPAHNSAREQIAAAKKKMDEELGKLIKEYNPLKQKLAINDQLKRIDDQLGEEKKRLILAKQMEQKKKENLDKAEVLKRQIVASRGRIHQFYATFCDVINAINRPDTSLEFCAETDIKMKSLYDAISSLFDNRGFRQFKDKYGYSLSDKDDLHVDDNLFITLWDAMLNSSSLGGLSLKGGNTIQTVLERLFSDWYQIHFSVKSGDDTIDQMSPGKKALVLLELIIYIEKGNCPILIDQPEDDLDNRSIYADLVQYLKQKKHERQIIVVTHNANVVVGADAEEVIIANQEGRETKNRSRRFEYRCGAIENTSPLIDSNGIVLGLSLIHI